MNKFISPKFELGAYNCPHCYAYANQTWWQPLYSSMYVVAITGFSIAKCHFCKNDSYWLNKKMIYPTGNGAMPPNPDLPENVISIYTEAASIVNSSPRGAMALLRLAIQELCIHLGETDTNLNNAIASLVRKGLLPGVQKALDVVRVIGNNAVHPGKIDLADDAELALRLFDLVNIIADQMITRHKQTEELFNKLPQNAIKSIETRDSKAK